MTGKAPRGPAYRINGRLRSLRMRKIQLREAKARLSAVIDAAVRGRPAVITRHGKPQAVVLSWLAHTPA